MELASRATYRGQVTKIVKSATEYLQSGEAQITDNVNKLESMEEELIVHLDRLKAALDNLRKANLEVRSSIKPEEFDREAETIAEYDDKALAAITRLNQRITKVRQRLSRLEPSNANITTSLPKEMSPALKLPKLQLRKFSGDSRDWMPFWEQYKSTVHENHSLSAVDKFNYLQSLLTGRAADTIAGFTPTEACYDSAIAMLKEEYGDTDKIVDQTMQRLLSLQPVNSRADVFGLRRLYNSVTSCTRSLTALGVSSTSYYVMLKGILLRCLPNELRVDFHRFFDNLSENAASHKVVDEPENNDDDKTDTSSITSASSLAFVGDNQVKNILRFLKREVESLEKAREAKSGSSQTQITKTVKTAVGLFAASTNEISCFFCKSSSHNTKDCSSPQTLMERKVMLKRDGRCFRCCKRGHNSKICRSGKLTCKKCNNRHATCMCDPEYSKKMEVVQQTPIDHRNNNTAALTHQPQQALNLCMTNTIPKYTNVFLQTACVFAASPDAKVSLYIRLIMDGGSQISFIKSSIARKLNLPIVGTQNLCVLPFGSEKRTPTQLFNRVRVMLRSQHDGRTIVLNVVEVPEICVDVLAMPNADDPTLKNFTLADARLMDRVLEEGISVLIGADTYWQFATGECQRISEKLTAINTLFGWTLQGPSPTCAQGINVENAYAMSVCISEELKKFWDLETIGIVQRDSTESVCDVNACVNRVGNRFVADLPWKPVNQKLNDNRSGALFRFHALVKKLLRQPGKLIEYDLAMQDFFLNGIAERAPASSLSDCVYFMPHRPVYRSDKSTTKVRIVFDASAHAPHSLSLNEHLETGSNLLPDLLKIILNFRCGKIGIVADIEKAFLQVSLNEKDRDSHRFFWFNDKINSTDNLPSLQIYRMTRVTFGVTCSPFLLGAAILRHLDMQNDRFPDTCSVLRSSFYMDDLVTSVDSKESAERLYKEAVIMMKEVSMTLHKWNSNDVDIRRLILTQEKPPESQKVLGIRWYISTDELAVDLEPVGKFIESPGRKEGRPSYKCR